MKKIILASQSLQRKLLMQSLSIPFEVKPANIDEKLIKASNHQERAKLIAFAKAQVVAKSSTNCIVIAGDTFLQLGSQAYEKPESIAEAKQMLLDQSGSSGICYTGFAYIDLSTHTYFNDVAVTKIHMRKLTVQEIDLYVSNNAVLTWSAGFSPAYPSGAKFIDSISGSFTGFVYGLPMELLFPLLQQSKVFDEKK